MATCDSLARNYLVAHYNNFKMYTILMQTNFKSGKFAMMGNELSREDTKELPQIVYPYQNDSYYAIVMSGSVKKNEKKMRISREIRKD